MSGFTPTPTTLPFWRTKRLHEMTEAEWESLCDGCGKCCLHKLQYEDSGEVQYTNIACKLLDLHACRCTRYAERRQHVPDCVKLRADQVLQLGWLPSTCAYRLLANGKDLPWWHYLVSGSRETVHKAGQSVRGRAIAERRNQTLEHFIVTWPE